MKLTLDLIPLLGYAASLYVLTGLVKTIIASQGKEAVARWQPYETMMPVILGMITAPTVVPWALEVMGLKTGDWPLAAAVMSGATAGALSSKLWDLIHKIGARWMRDQGGAQASENSG